MKNLNELSKEYAQNIIDQETYRSSRSELIRGICAGEIEVKDNEYLAPLEYVDDKLDDTTENMITQIITQEKKTKLTPESKRPQAPEPRHAHASKYPSIEKFSQKSILIGSLLIVVICLIIMTVLISPATKEAPPKQLSKQLITQPSTGQELIIEFIQQKNWSQGNLDSFVASWQQLTVLEQEAVHASPEMKRLTSTIYRQLLDERALISLGDIENSVANQKSLVNFTEKLGIVDKRFKVVAPEPEPEINTDTEINQEIIEPNNKIIEPTTKTEIDTDKALLVEANELPENATVEMPKETVITTDNLMETKTEEVTTELQDPVQEAPVKEIDVEDTGTKTPAVELNVQKPVNKAACKTSLVKSRKPFCREKIEDIGYGPTMVVISGGKFTMGGKYEDEQPAHTVTIGSHFAMSVHEISYDEFEKYCKSTNLPCPAQPWSAKEYPIVNITHSDATSYAKWLSQKTGQTYRLPSESEWEYAARAGTKTAYPFGDEILITDAVFSDKKKLSAPLPKSDRSVNRNKFRLYHMVGNVREWVADTWSKGYSGAPDDGSARVDKSVNEYIVRGGSYADAAEALRSGARAKLSSADNFTGFRLLQELSE